MESWELDLQRRFGERLRALRTARGMSQETLALESGMSPDFISHLERGQRSPSLRTLARLARTLTVELPELVDVRQS